MDNILKPTWPVSKRTRSWYDEYYKQFNEEKKKKPKNKAERVSAATYSPNQGGIASSVSSSRSSRRQRGAAASPKSKGRPETGDCILKESSSGTINTEISTSKKGNKYNACRTSSKRKNLGSTKCYTKETEMESREFGGAGGSESPILITESDDEDNHAILTTETDDEDNHPVLTTESHEEDARAVLKSKCLDHCEINGILANSIINDLEVPHEEEKEAAAESELLAEPVLPKEFDTGDSAPTEKSDGDAELENLWDEMNFSLQSDAIGNSMEINIKAIGTPKDEVEVDDIDTLCRQGKHQYILDEETGVKCMYCSYVDIEIRYHVAPFCDRPFRGARQYKPDHWRRNIFSKLQDLDSGYDSEVGSDLISLKSGTAWDLIPGVRKGLHPHQVDGFEFIWKNIAGGIDLVKLKESRICHGGGGCLISHAPGTGKTRLAIVFLQAYLEMYPSCRPVVIAPSSMLPTWEAEFEKWKVGIPFHNLNKVELSGKENQVALQFLRKGRSGQATITNKRLVKLHSWKKEKSILAISYTLFEQLTGEDGKKSTDEDEWVRKILLDIPGIIVLDEVHTARNNNSQTWKALTKIRTEKRITLSGTPFQNNFEELYNTLSLVRPKFADGTFMRTFTKRRGHKRSEEARGNWASLTGSISKVGNEISKAKRIEQVRRMIDPFVHIHRGDILQQKLRGLREYLIILRQDEFQKRLIDRVRGYNVSPIDREHLVSLLSVHPSSLLEKDSFNIGGLDKRRLDILRLLPEAGAKTKFLMKLIKLSLSLNERVLVFSQYHSPLALICKQLEYHFNWEQGAELLYMDGQTDIDQRQSIIKKLNDRNSEAKVLLASTKACSEGINLIGASRVVLLDVVWNPSVERQAISRAYRLGQKKVVYIYHLIASGTMEEDKYRRQARKERLSDLVFYSADKSCTHDPKILDNNKDMILEAMLEHDKFKTMFDKIIYEPKSSTYMESFGSVCSV